MKLPFTPEQLTQYLEDQLERVRRISSTPHQYTARCPFHDDDDPSLSFNTEKQCWSCFAGCGTGNLSAFEQRRLGRGHQAVIEHIAEVCGVPQPLLRLSGDAPTTIYPYVDEDGRILFEVVRTDLPDGKKRIRQRRPKPSGGGFIYDLKGTRRVLYRLHEVITANIVIITEGEKDAELVRSLDWSPILGATGRLAVTTNPGGAGKWSEEYSRYLAGKHVYMFYDRDTAGISHRDQVVSSIHQVTQMVKIAELPEGFHDVGDFIEAGHDAKELYGVIKAAPWWKPTATQGNENLGILLSQVQPEEVDWLWQDWIPQGKLTILEGDAGLGKSTITIDLAARITTGRPMPDGKESCTGGVIILTAEDALADTVRPRLDAAAGNAELILCMGMIKEGDMERLFSIPDDLPKLEEAIRRMGAKLAIFDPLVPFLNAGVDSYKDQQVRRALAPLAALAERTGVAALVIRHLSKAEDKRPINRGAGSIAFGAAARSVIAVAKDPDFPDDSGKFVMASVKSNLAACPQSQEYAIEQAGNGISRILWMGPSEHTAESLLTVHRRSAKSKLDDAEDFVKDALASGPQKSEDVKREAKQFGIAPRTLRRAMKKLGVKPYLEGLRGDWMCRLPDEFSGPDSQLAND